MIGSLALMAALAVGQQYNASGGCQVFVGSSVGIPAQTGLFSVTPPPQNYWRNVWVNPDHWITPDSIGVTNFVKLPADGAQVGWTWRIQWANGYWACSAAGIWHEIETYYPGVYEYEIDYNVIAVWHADPSEEWEVCDD